MCWLFQKNKKLSFELVLFGAKHVAGFHTPKHNAFDLDHELLQTRFKRHLKPFLRNTHFVNVDKLSNYSYLFDEKQA